MSVNTKMTAIADKVRTLLGVSGKMGLDAMAANLQTACTEVSNAYTAISEKGGTLPGSLNIVNLPTAIDSISGLNFEVVGGTSAPANPVANTIWVNTSTAITSYYFSSTQPENMANGAVWFPTRDNSSVAFNALKENCIQVYPSKATQMVNGELVDVEAKTYLNGAWADWYRGELYDNGNQYESITGGWTAYTQNGTTYTLGANSIQFSGGGSGTIYTNQMVDMSGYTTLYAEVTVTNTGENVTLGLSSRNNTINADYRVVEKSITKPSTQKHTIAVDISNINESHYVHFNCWKSGGTIHKIWRE